jgi:dinuclear metal center YbgI/SA1388 family protein
MLIHELINIINRLLPPETAMQGDRIGLQIEGKNPEIHRILIAYEVNPQVVQEAVVLKADCIITFHPLIFNPLTAIKLDNRVGRLVTEIIQNSISLIAIHTNFDSFAEGTSKILAEELGLPVTGFLVPDKSIPDFGMGIISNNDQPITLDSLLQKIFNICHSPLKYNKTKDVFHSIAIVGGSGSSFIPDVIEKKIDCFITSDLTYHRFHDVEGKLTLIDPGHYEMEQFVPLGLVKLLTYNLELANIDSIFTSKVRTNPVFYYPNTFDYDTEQENYLINNKIMVEFK